MSRADASPYQAERCGNDCTERPPACLFIEFKIVPEIALTQ